MRVLLNGFEREFPEGQTLRQMIDGLALPPERVAVELNGEIVPRATYGETVIREGDRLEVVQFVGGG
jgi:thiamine biosynthesis protein ThiS